MFYLDRETELNIQLLQKMIHSFNVNVVPKLQRYRNYYDGVQDILNKRYADATKPCNKTVINYCLNLVNSYAGYIATPGHINYRSDNDIEMVMDILRYNDYQTADSDLLLDALIYGVGAELMFIDADAQTRFRRINPVTCFGVYDNSLTGDLMYFVRMYKMSEWDDSNKYKVDVYTDNAIKHYVMEGQNGKITFVNEEPHYFSQCPANIFYLPDEKSIFDCVMSEQDAVNELVSAEIDDFAAFVDSYLLLIGVDADADDIAKIKQDRVLVLPPDATAQYLTKSYNDTQVENILKRLHESIYRIAQCPDFSSESFIGGVSSGIAIQYRLTGMETRAGKIEAEMKKALQRRIEIICGIASLRLGEEVFRDIQIEFKRNIPVDNSATINLINALKGTVSDATLLSQLDFIPDVNAELEALKAQKADNMELYGFSTFSTDEEEVVE